MKCPYTLHSGAFTTTAPRKPLTILQARGKFLEEVLLKETIRCDVAVGNLTTESKSCFYLIMELQTIVGSVRLKNLRALHQHEDMTQLAIDDTLKALGKGESRSEGRSNARILPTYLSPYRLQHETH